MKPKKGHKIHKPKCLRGTSVERPIIELKNGILAGRNRITSNGFPFSSFTRIPFAEPPIGPLRFSLPLPASPWKGVLDASRPCPKPVQTNYVTGLLEGTEDCLYLNVYRPEQGGGAYDATAAAGSDDADADSEPCSDALLPVMYWVYGGGFIMGDATEENYLPGPLIETDQVIVVSANYRVGPLGFLSLEDDVMPGNFALWDQRMSLLWVKENIRQFGGDPNNVTVFGESAGSFCVMCLYVSPQCEGLFHKAVGQSGPLISNCSATMVMGKRPSLYAKTFARQLGCTELESSKQLLNQLQEIPIAKLQDKFSFSGDWDVSLPCPWKPLVDQWSSNPFLPKDPRSAILAGEFNKTPLLHGICSHEGVMMVSHLVKEPKRWQVLKESWWKYLSMIAFHNHIEDMDKHDQEVIESIKEEYLGGRDVCEDTTLQLVDLFTDSYFKVGTLETCQLLAAQGVHAFQYRFCYRGSWKFADLLTMTAGQLALKLAMAEVGVAIAGPDVGGVCHAEELHYLFSPTMPGFRNTLPTEQDRAMSRKMATHWTNFARFGNPSADIEWAPVGVNETWYMELNENDELKEFSEDEMRKFRMWKEIFAERRGFEVPNTLLIVQEKHILSREKKNLNLKIRRTTIGNLIQNVI